MVEPIYGLLEQLHKLLQHQLLELIPLLILSVPDVQLELVQEQLQLHLHQQLL